VTAPALIEGRFRVVEILAGSASHGVMRAVDADGRRCVVSVAYHRAGVLPALLRDERFAAPWIARVLFSREVPGDRVVLVEEEPPGVPSVWAPPLAPSAIRDAALAIARLLATSPGLTGLLPDFVYIHNGRLSGIAPRSVPLWEARAGANAGMVLPFRVDYFSREQIVGRPQLTRAHDVYVLANLIAFWGSGAPPLFWRPDDQRTDIMIRILQGAPRLADDGPFAEVIAACLAARPLDEIVGRLAALRLDEADAAHAARARMIAEIVARPDDDGPRLVYADCLLERGDPRGEFIQVQCQQAARPSEALAARAAALIAAHGQRWGAHLLPEARSWTFARGFVDRVPHLDPQRRAALLAHGPLPEVAA